METANLAEALRNTYLLNGLSQEQVDAVTQVTQVTQLKQFNGGDTILRQFSKDSDLLVVLEGTVRINSFAGEKLAEAGPGSIIGEMALVDDQPRSATVVSVGVTKAAVIPSKDLWALMKQDAHLARTVLLNLARSLSTKLRAANIQADLGVRR